MVIGRVLDLFDPGRPPNNFSELSGRLVKQARLDLGISQLELARKIYVRQATISEIENGKRYINAVELLLLSDALEKPILYFVPEKYRKRIQKDLTDPELDELLLIAQKLNRQDLQRLIVQTRALVKNS